MADCEVSLKDIGNNTLTAAEIVRRVGEPPLNWLRSRRHGCQKFQSIFGLHCRNPWSGCVSQILRGPGDSQYPDLSSGQHLSSCDQHHLVLQRTLCCRRDRWDHLLPQEWPLFPQVQLLGGVSASDFRVWEFGLQWSSKIPLFYLDDDLIFFKLKFLEAPEKHYPKSNTSFNQSHAIELHTAQEEEGQCVNSNNKALL